MAETELSNRFAALADLEEEESDGDLVEDPPSPKRVSLSPFRLTSFKKNGILDTLAGILGQSKLVNSDGHSPFWVDLN